MRFLRLAVVTCYAVLAVVLGLGLYLRLESVSGTEVLAPIRADAADYFFYAYNLRHHNVYSRMVADMAPALVTSSPVPDALRSPGYPLFLALFTGGEPTANMLREILNVQAVIGTLTALLAFLVTRVALSPLAAISTALLVAISPHLVTGTHYILTENLFAFLVTGSMVFHVLWQRNPGTQSALWAGLSIGLATLVRPTMQFFPVFFLPYLMKSSGWQKGKKPAAVYLIAFLLCLAPWHLRNMVSLGKFSDPTLMINQLHQGMYPDFMYNGIPDTYGYPYRFDPRTPEITRDLPSVLREITDHFIQRPVEQIRWYFLGKPSALWGWGGAQQASDILIYEVARTPYSSHFVFKATYWFSREVHPLVVLLGILGCLLVWIRNGKDRQVIRNESFLKPVALLLFYVTALHIAGAPYSRLAHPFYPVLYLMATVPPVLACRWFRSREIRKSAA